MEIDFLIRKCGREVILKLCESKETSTATSIFKASNISVYSYVVRIVKKMVNAGLITREKTGRQYDLVLTEKGYKVVRSLKFIEKTLGGIEIC